jgi:hypothetical protein
MTELTVVLVKMIRLQNPWQKFSCKTGTALTIKEQENLERSFACKDPNVSPFKTNFHHDACGGFRQKICTMRNVTETVKQIIINVFFLLER